VFAIFGFADVRGFSDVTEALGPKLLSFTNQIADLIHEIVHKHKGGSNKNLGNAFLFVWKPSASQLRRATQLLAAHAHAQVGALSPAENAVPLVTGTMNHLSFPLLESPAGIDSTRAHHIRLGSPIPPLPSSTKEDKLDSKDSHIIHVGRHASTDATTIDPSAARDISTKLNSQGGSVHVVHSNGSSMLSGPAPPGGAEIRPARPSPVHALHHSTTSRLLPPLLDEQMRHMGSSGAMQRELSPIPVNGSIIVVQPVKILSLSPVSDSVSADESAAQRQLSMSSLPAVPSSTPSVDVVGNVSACSPVSVVARRVSVKAKKRPSASAAWAEAASVDELGNGSEVAEKQLPLISPFHSPLFAAAHASGVHRDSATGFSLEMPVGSQVSGARHGSFVASNSAGNSAQQTDGHASAPAEPSQNSSSGRSSPSSHPSHSHGNTHHDTRDSATAATAASVTNPSATVPTATTMPTAQGPRWETLKQLADDALVAFLQSLVAVATARELASWRTDPALVGLATAKSPSATEYRIDMGFGLHAGWAIEGSIGSQLKIDASYLSPNVNIAARLDGATKQYGVPLLFSGAFASLLHPDIRSRCRLLDRITVKGSSAPIDIYTFDMGENALLPDGQQRAAGSLNAGAAAPVHEGMEEHKQVEGEVVWSESAADSAALSRPPMRLADAGIEHSSSSSDSHSEGKPPVVQPKHTRHTRRLSQMANAAQRLFQGIHRMTTATGIVTLHGTEGTVTTPRIHTQRRNNQVGQSDTPLPPAVELQSIGNTHPNELNATPILHTPLANASPSTQSVPMAGTPVAPRSSVIPSRLSLICARLQSGLAPTFVSHHTMAVSLYLRGRWSRARTLLELHVLPLRPMDGPALRLIQRMKEHNFKAPKNWPGYTKLTDK
jgi:class 3 adenylate cyclase